MSNHHLGTTHTDTDTDRDRDRDRAGSLSRSPRGSNNGNANRRSSSRSPRSHELASTSNSNSSPPRNLASSRRLGGTPRSGGSRAPRALGSPRSNGATALTLGLARGRGGPNRSQVPARERGAAAPRRAGLRRERPSLLETLLPDLIFNIVSFLPPRNLGIMKTVCKFFSDNYGKWPMNLPELVAKMRFPTHMFKGPHQNWVEALLYRKCFQGPVTQGYVQFPVFPVSTISLSFSCDRKHFASSHGDHSVKIIEFATGKIKQQLIGHPRTPWSVKFHPNKPNILASGCLGSHVFVWDTNTGRRIRGAVAGAHVLSLSFHPTGSVLAIACTEMLMLWDYSIRSRPMRRLNIPGADPSLYRGLTNPCAFPDVPNSLETSLQPTPIRAIRCVIFHPCGNLVLIGEVPKEHHRTGTVTLQMWHYDDTKPLQHRISNPRPLCEAAQLYSDGGIDVSQCGRVLVTLRKGVDPHSYQFLSVAVVSLHPSTFGRNYCYLPLEPSAAKHVTSVKISPSKNFILIGYSSVGDDRYTSNHPVVRIYKINWKRRRFTAVYEEWGSPALPRAPQHASRSNYNNHDDDEDNGDGEEEENAVEGDEEDDHSDGEEDTDSEEDGQLVAMDDSNMCVFHPIEGQGLIFGTKQGTLKWNKFTRASAIPTPVPNDSTSFARAATSATAASDASAVDAAAASAGGKQVFASALGDAQ